MRIHSDLITASDIYTATRDLPGVYAEVTTHGSRSRRSAFEVRLEGNGYARNTGNAGADNYENAATWDEWGVVIARLFDIDPDAFCGTAKYPAYRNAEDFHAQTDNRFMSGEMPDDTHKRHSWEWSNGNAICKRCSARTFRAA